VFDSEVRPTEVGPSLFDLCARVNGPRRRESRAKRVARMSAAKSGIKHALKCLSRVSLSRNPRYGAAEL